VIADAEPLCPAQLVVEDVDPDQRGRDRERELAERGEQGRRAAQSVVVEVEREEAGDERKHGDPEAVVQVRVRGGADERERDRARDQPEAEADGRNVLERELSSEVAAEHCAHAPQRRGRKRLDDRLPALGVRVERVWQSDQPDSGKSGEENPREPAARPARRAQTTRRARQSGAAPSAARRR
jgi:hypothetical protein